VFLFALYSAVFDSYIHIYIFILSVFNSVLLLKLFMVQVVERTEFLLMFAPITI